MSRGGTYAGALPLAHDREHHRVEVLHVDRAAAPEVAVADLAGERVAPTTRSRRPAPRPGGRAPAARRGDGSAPGMRATRLARPGRRLVDLATRRRPRRACPPRTRRRARSPALVRGSPVLVVSIRSRSRQRSTTSSSAAGTAASAMRTFLPARGAGCPSGTQDIDEHPIVVLPSRYEPGAAAPQGGLRDRRDGQRHQGGLAARPGPARPDRTAPAHRTHPRRPAVRARPARRPPDRARRARAGPGPGAAARDEGPAGRGGPAGRHRHRDGPLSAGRRERPDPRRPRAPARGGAAAGADHDVRALVGRRAGPDGRQRPAGLRARSGSAATPYRLRISVWPGVSWRSTRSS